MDTQSQAPTEPHERRHTDTEADTGTRLRGGEEGVNVPGRERDFQPPRGSDLRDALVRHLR